MTRTVRSAARAASASWISRSECGSAWAVAVDEKEDRADGEKA